jgi:hypothetical protein
MYISGARDIAFAIGQRLRQVYSAQAVEPLPDRLQRLLDALAEEKRPVATKPAVPAQIESRALSDRETASYEQPSA